MERSSHPFAGKEKLTFTHLYSEPATASNQGENAERSERGRESGERESGEEVSESGEKENDDDGKRRGKKRGENGAEEYSTKATSNGERRRRERRGRREARRRGQDDDGEERGQTTRTARVQRGKTGGLEASRNLEVLKLRSTTGSSMASSEEDESEDGGNDGEDGEGGRQRVSATASGDGGDDGEDGGDDSEDDGDSGKGMRGGRWTVTRMGAARRKWRERGWRSDGGMGWLTGWERGMMSKETISYTASSRNSQCEGERGTVKRTHLSTKSHRIWGADTRRCAEPAASRGRSFALGELKRRRSCQRRRGESAREDSP
ncbi:hypothetical protein DFH06DRAFT_1294546 [Mycena polygramma]|nr:hypothetical protein DFH06DRAFT_1294546 [Mycena polygramma]